MTWHNAVCCERCWIDREGTWKEIHPGILALISVPRPTRLTEAPIEECCFCGGPTISGIYVRANPKEMPWPCTHAVDAET